LAHCDAVWGGRQPLHLTQYFHRELTHPQFCVVVYDAVNVGVSFCVSIVNTNLTSFVCEKPLDCFIDGFDKYLFITAYTVSNAVKFFY
jgi:hypothetical protein